MCAGDQLGVELCGIAAVGHINEALRIDLDVTPVSWIFMWQLLSRGQILRSMEDFADKVLPEFGGVGGRGVEKLLNTRAKPVVLSDCIRRIATLQ